VDTVRTRLERALVPIYAEGSRHPLLVGSGVLVFVGGAVFLVTAAHVADGVPIKGRLALPQYWSDGRQLWPLSPVHWRSALGPDGTRATDPYDLADWLIPPTHPDQQVHAKAVPLDGLDIPPGVHGLEWEEFFVNGYVASQQPRYMEGNVYKSLSFGFFTDHHPSYHMIVAGANPMESLLLDYRKDDVRVASVGDVEGPDPYGLSGGPVWRLSGPGASRTVPKLAGIMTEWRSRQEPLGIVATRMYVWVHLLISRYPWLKRIMPPGLVPLEAHQPRNESAEIRELRRQRAAEIREVRRRRR
jgi:hypothetical protein